MGGSYTSEALSALVRVFRYEIYCYVLFCHFVSCLYLFMLNKHFRVQVQVQWNFDWNSNIFIQENAFQNIVCEMAPIRLVHNVLNGNAAVIAAVECRNLRKLTSLC